MTGPDWQGWDGPAQDLPGAGQNILEGSPRGLPGTSSTVPLLFLFLLLFVCSVSDVRSNLSTFPLLCLEMLDNTGIFLPIHCCVKRC